MRSARALLGSSSGQSTQWTAEDLAARERALAKIQRHLRQTIVVQETRGCSLSSTYDAPMTQSQEMTMADLQELALGGNVPPEVLFALAAQRGLSDKQENPPACVETRQRVQESDGSEEDEGVSFPRIADSGRPKQAGGGNLAEQSQSAPPLVESPGSNGMESPSRHVDSGRKSASSGRCKGPLTGSEQNQLRPPTLPSCDGSSDSKSPGISAGLSPRHGLLPAWESQTGHMEEDRASSPLLLEDAPGGGTGDQGGRRKGRRWTSESRVGARAQSGAAGGNVNEPTVAGAGGGELEEEQEDEGQGAEAVQSGDMARREERDAGSRQSSGEVRGAPEATSLAESDGSEAMGYGGVRSQGEEGQETGTGTRAGKPVTITIDVRRLFPCCMDV